MVVFISWGSFLNLSTFVEQESSIVMLSMSSDMFICSKL